MKYIKKMQNDIIFVFFIILFLFNFADFEKKGNYISKEKKIIIEL
jgi:hypothetical protein